MAELLQLYSYWRSSAAYRVRIGLNLKRLRYALKPVHLVRDGGQQHHDAYVQLNPQHLLPTLLHGGRVMRQSLAILEYLDESWPEHPLLPATGRDRARVRALSQLVAMDIHPLNNLRVLRFFEEEWSVPPVERDAWVRHWIAEGFQAMETLLADDPATGTYCHGEVPGMADCCLVPQVYNARRFGVDMAAYPTIARVEQACLQLPAFARASPEQQPDAPQAAATGI
ncbi:maleylacetoacetate isomerase [Pseudoxanthomonas sp.]|uniref:maleylacetoacetate isomerase n=1 Tax=Pseudoxanthomonas sp. TaxID=1871049 RepID=UPI002612DC08|nr:maleylacetoacetate isomerase [Pseudoxanthomonas sp.]WDS35623.1 MAG: maleylacetoacetate isomerase [Pseudoxanthomonas sp.]